LEASGFEKIPTKMELFQVAELHSGVEAIQATNVGTKYRRSSTGGDEIVELTRTDLGR